MLDMLIQGGRVVTPAGVGNWTWGSWASRLSPWPFRAFSLTAKHVIDARGKIVVPGGIETHAHAVANVSPALAPWWLECPTPGRWSTLWGPSGAARRQWSILPRAHGGRPGPGDPQLPDALAGQCVHGLFHALYLHQPQSP